MSFGVVSFGFDESFGDVLAVGTDILNGSGTGLAGDFAEGFDAGEISLDCVINYVVPRGSAHDFKKSDTVLDSLGDTGEIRGDDDTREKRIMTNGVGTATEDEGGEMIHIGKFKSLGDFGGILCGENIAGGAADTHSGER